VWQIEPSKEDRSICRDCNRYIARGAHRFGNYELDRWYHLDCAAVRSSRAFAPFAKEAAALLAPAAPVARAQPPRDRAMEARLLAQPDLGMMSVFADALLRAGDPWGELIACEIAGNSAAAREVLKDHYDDLIGNHAPRIFEWRHGFIHKVALELVPTDEATRIISDVVSLRTAILLRELHVPLPLRPEAFAVIARSAPSLRHLSIWFTNHVDRLAHERLERLTVHMTLYANPHIPTLQHFLAATHVPALRRLRLEGATLPVSFLSALLDSKLVQQLACFEIADETLDGGGEHLLERRGADLAHIPVLNFPVALDGVFPVQKAAWRARAADEP
jgi:hypothetical protein